MIIKKFNTIADFQAYTSQGLKSGILYCVEENKSVHFATNNIDGDFKEYHVVEGTQGTQGTSGTAGTAGTGGTQGTEGTAGTAGTQGTSGTEGTQGGGA